MKRIQLSRDVYKNKIEPFLHIIEDNINSEDYKLIYEYYFTGKKTQDVAKIKGYSDNELRNEIECIKKQINKVIYGLAIENGQVVHRDINMDSEIEYLPFEFIRTHNVLSRNGVRLIKDLSNYSLLDISNFTTMGDKSFWDFVNVLKNTDLNLIEVLKSTNEQDMCYVAPEVSKRVIEALKLLEDE